MNLATSKLAQLEYMKATRQLVDSRTDQDVRKMAHVKFGQVSTSRITDVNYIYSPEFKQNLYNGRGLGLWKDKHNKFNGEWDNLFIRGFMKIWELQINTLRAENGTLIIGSAGQVGEAGVADTGVANEFYLTFDHDDSAQVQPFAVGDIICSKKFWLVNDDTNTQDTPAAWIDQTVAEVTAITVGGVTNKITVQLDVANSSIDPYDGQQYVRCASSNANRRGLVVLSSDGIDGDALNTAEVPFVDVYDGLETFQNFLDAMAGSKTFLKVRMGRLDKLTGVQNQFGIWTSNIIMEGDVEGANSIHVGTEAEMLAYDTTLLNTGDMWLVSDLGYEIWVWNGSAWANRRPVANQILYGTAAARASYNTDLLHAGDMWVETDNENKIMVWEGAAWVDRRDDTIPTDAVGNLILPPVTQSGSGLSMNDSYLGYHVSNSWRTYMDKYGNFYLSGASNNMFQWLYSSASLTIGSDTATGSRMVFSGGSNTIDFYDNYNVNYMNLGTDIGGSGYSGLNLQRYGFIYKYNTYGNAVSTIHSELYNQSITYVGGLSTLVSTTSDASTPALTTINIMSGIKAQSYVTGAYNGAGIIAVTNGNSSGDVYGIYAHSSNVGSGYGWAGYFKNQCYINENLQIDGYLKVGAVGGEVQTIGKIRVAWNSSYSSNYGLAFGKSSYDVNLFQSGAHTLKCDQNFNVSGTLYTSAGIEVAGSIKFGAATQVGFYKGGAALISTADALGIDKHLIMKELSSAPAHYTGYGILWVKNDAQTPLRYTTEVGQDDYVATVYTGVGHPSAWQGRIHIDESINTIYIYAESSWRTLLVY